MKTRSAFTLVELVVVILILGILAGVAAPKLLSVSGEATENGLRQTLSIVRNGIELHAARNGGALPSGPEATFKTALAEHIRGDFPISPYGNGDNSIRIITTGAATGDGTAGWLYHSGTGEFVCDDAAYDDY